MKTRFPFFCVGVASLSAAAVLLTRMAGSAAPPPEKVLARTRAFDSNKASNAIPVSVFSVSTNKMSGRDPFYPDCNCGTRIVVSVPSVDPNKPSVALVYMGRSGTPERPLAIINGGTFEQGETQNVPTSSGTRVPLKLIEIKESSVIVEIGGKQRQELFLRGN